MIHLRISNIWTLSFKKVFSCSGDAGAVAGRLYGNVCTSPWEGPAVPTPTQEFCRDEILICVRAGKGISSCELSAMRPSVSGAGVKPHGSRPEAPPGVRCWERLSLIGNSAPGTRSERAHPAMQAAFSIHYLDLQEILCSFCFCLWLWNCSSSFSYTVVCSLVVGKTPDNSYALFGSHESFFSRPSLRSLPKLRAHISPAGHETGACGYLPLPWFKKKI